MKYSLFFYHQDGKEAGLAEADMAPWQAAFVDYTNALNDAGVFVSMDALQSPKTATTITLKEGSLQVQDGPYADTKEGLGGYYVINVPDLDDAFVQALKSWPEAGIPDNLEGWLLAVARNRQKDLYKSSAFSLDPPMGWV